MDEDLRNVTFRWEKAKNDSPFYAGLEFRHCKNIYSCEYCDFETKEKENLTSHNKSNHGLSCILCEIKFETKVSLEMHIKFKHVCK